MVDRQLFPPVLLERIILRSLHRFLRGFLCMDRALWIALLKYICSLVAFSIPSQYESLVYDVVPAAIPASNGVLQRFQMTENELMMRLLLLQCLHCTDQF